MLLMIFIVWALSALTSIPPLFGWGKPSANLKENGNGRCMVSNDLKYQIYATLLAFYVPLIVIIIIYANIYRAARKIKKREMETAGNLRKNTNLSIPYSPESINNLRAQTETLIDNNNNTTTTTTTNNNGQKDRATKKSSRFCKKKQKQQQQQQQAQPSNSIKNAVSEQGSIESKAAHSSISSQDTGNSKEHRLSVNLMPNSILTTSPNNIHHLHQHQHHHGGGGGGNLNNSSHVTVNSPSGTSSRRGSFGKRVGRRFTQVFSGIKRNSGTSSAHGKNKKATRTLGVIMGCFILCWLPFFIVALLKPISIGGGRKISDIIPKWLDTILLWLGYLNSTLNPMIYARFNREFRRPFIEILCFRCKGINQKLRDEERRKMLKEDFMQQSAASTRRPSNMNALSLLNGVPSIDTARGSICTSYKRANPNEEEGNVEFKRSEMNLSPSFPDDRLRSAIGSIDQKLRIDYDDSAEPERRKSTEEVTRHVRSLKKRFFNIRDEDDLFNTNNSNNNDESGNESADQMSDRLTATIIDPNTLLPKVGALKDFLDLTKIVKLNEINYFKSSDPEYSSSTILAGSNTQPADSQRGHESTRREESVGYFFTKMPSVEHSPMIVNSNQSENNSNNNNNNNQDDTLSSRTTTDSTNEQYFSKLNSCRTLNNDNSSVNNLDDNNNNSSGKTSDDCFKNINRNEILSKKYSSFDSAKSIYENSIQPSRSMPNYQNDSELNKQSKLDNCLDEYDEDLDVSQQQLNSSTAKSQQQLVADSIEFRLNETKNSYNNDLNPNGNVLNSNDNNSINNCTNNTNYSTSNLFDKRINNNENNKFQFSLNSIPTSSECSFVTALTSPASYSLQSPLVNDSSKLTLNTTKDSLDLPGTNSNQFIDPNSIEASRLNKLLNYSTKHQSMDQMRASTNDATLLRKQSAKLPSTSTSLNAQLSNRSNDDRNNLDEQFKSGDANYDESSLSNNVEHLEANSDESQQQQQQLLNKKLTQIQRSTSHTSYPITNNNNQSSIVTSSSAFILQTANNHRSDLNSTNNNKNEIN